MAQEFIANPTLLIRQLLRIQATDASFEYGRFAMACEIVTVIRTLESYESLLPAEHSASLIGVLQTMLSDQELNWVYRVYDELSANRRPIFVPLPSPSASADADGSGQMVESDDHASAHEVPSQEKPPVERLRALSVVRQSQDDEPIDEQLELTVEVDEGTSTE